MVAVHGPIVVGADGSEGAARAVRWAAAEADSRSVPLHVVNATALDTWGHLPSEPVARSVLDEGLAVVNDAVAQAEKEAPGIRVTARVSRDAAAEALLDAAGSDGLVVVGSRGAGGFPALLLGSVGLRVAACAQAPVVVVRGESEPAATGVVLVAVRDARDLDVLRFAAETAKRRRAALHVLSVYSYHQYAGSMVPVLGDLAEVAEEQAASVARLVRPVSDAFPDLPVTTEAARAHSLAGAVVDATARADLLVVGAHRPAHAPGKPLGRFVHVVLHHAHCPVAVVPIA
ncbi:universal stress protein [Streptomyces sp. NPDC048566]|uniref:universal stress protein n=1 Tax=Streptomyces sp. NPDC048566 TaxID=3365569 RepID=UPI003711D14B